MNKKIGYARMKIERRARWDRLWRPVDFILRFLETRYWNMRGYTIVECFGDSHVKVFRRLNWMYPERPIRLRTISVMGATAYGIANYNSKTHAREKFEKRLKELPEKQNVILLLGEIDTGFLIWSLAATKKVPVDRILKETIKRYADFISYVKEMDKIITICSAPLPTLGNDLAGPDYLSTRSTIDVPIRERTELTLKFNSKIQEFCEALDIDFIDLDHFSIDPETGLLKGVLVNSNCNDHHYEENAYASMLESYIFEKNLFKKR